MPRSFYLITILAVILVSCSEKGSSYDVLVSRIFLRVIPQVELLGAGDSRKIEIDSNGNWTVEKPESATWLTVNPNSGTGMGSFNVAVSRNVWGESRTTELNVSSENLHKTIVVIQNVADDYAINNPANVGDFISQRVRANSVELMFSYSSDSDVASYGVCYSTMNESPTVNEGKVIVTGDERIGTKNIIIDGLVPSTAYYVRAFVINSGGISYNSAIAVVTLPN